MHEPNKQETASLIGLKVKICGITNYSDALQATDLGAWALGFVFYKKSPRYIEPNKVMEILTQLQKERATIPLTVGVFVHETAVNINAIIATAGVQVAQLHWVATEGLAVAINNDCIQVLRHSQASEKGEATQDTVAENSALTNVSVIAASKWVLIDSFHADEYGGTGKTSDWMLAKKYKSLKPVILSGGLTHLNVLQAISEVQPYAVDLSSGVEEVPGKKSSKKLIEFFDVLHDLPK